MSILSPSDPRPVEVVNAGGRSDFVLICDQAGATIPEQLKNLSLPTAELLKHIAYDSGAEDVARRLAQQLAAPLVLQTYSRLVIDCNRLLEAPDCIPRVSDGTIVPGNLLLNESDRRQRYTEIHEPFHREITQLLDRRVAVGAPTILIVVHSVTPPLAGGGERSRLLGVLSNCDRRFAERFLVSFQRRHPAILSAHNEPYLIHDICDHTIQVHGDGRGLPHLLVGIRNDLIREADGQRLWADLIAEALEDINAKELVKV
ncbi:MULTISPECIES: N-formylglutamate amidohydrolase [unclassified Bradyrhizobium]